MAAHRVCVATRGGCVEARGGCEEACGGARSFLNFETSISKGAAAPCLASIRNEVTDE